MAISPEHEPLIIGNEPNYQAITGLFGDEISPALDTLMAYGDVAHDNNNRTVTHPIEVALLLRDFTDNLVSPLTYSGAMLHDIGQRVSVPDYRRNAVIALKDFATHSEITPKDWEFVGTILSDLNMIEDCAEAVRTSTTIGDKRLAAVLRGDSQIVEPWMWRSDSQVIDPAVMLDLIEKVNLEPFLIKSAETLHNLLNPAPKDRAVLQDIYEAEAFYAPILELLGLDAMAMALRSVCAEIRLERSGSGNMVQQAREIVAELGDRDSVAAAISGVLRDFVGAESIVDHSIENRGQHQIMLGDTAMQYASGSEMRTMRAVWRAKSVGSTALKLTRGLASYDLVGITMMTADREQSVHLYKRLLANAEKLRATGKIGDSDEQRPLDVRGSEEFLDLLRQHIGHETMDGSEWDVVPTTNNYEVAKMTFRYLTEVAGGQRRSLPVEIAVQTEDARVDTRTGDSSHMAYKVLQLTGKKTGEMPFDSGVLSQIYARKATLGTRGITPASAQRGEAFRREITESRYRRPVNYRRR